MKRGWTRIAAAALAAVAIVPWPAGAAPDGLAAADREAAAAESLLRDAERAAGARLDDRTASAEAVLQLAEALRRDGHCAAAAPRYEEALARAELQDRGAALTGALECAVKERRHADAERLVAEAQRVFGDALPADLRYLSAKALFQRTDLPQPERIRRAREAFARVGPPHELQAWYFRGVLAIQDGDVGGALAPFGRCAEADPEDERQREVRDLCRMALGRVHADLGDAASAARWYRDVPGTSPRLDEALHELASIHARARQLAPALAMATFAADVAPGSPLAPEARLLRGDLLLELGRHAEAKAAYGAVVESYAPVRDALGTRHDPAGTFDALFGAAERPRAGALPPLATAWARRDADVARARAALRDLHDADRELKDLGTLAGRIAALLERDGGSDAFPAVQRARAGAQAAENAAARAEAAYVTALGEAAAGALRPEERAELERARAARREAEVRFERLPHTLAGVDERLAGLRRRIDAVDRDAFRLGIAIAGCVAAIDAAGAWVEQRRAELGGDEEAARGVRVELDAQRVAVDGYASELAEIRGRIAVARDAAGRVGATPEEARILAEYLAALEREWAAVRPARAAVDELFPRVDEARRRLGALRARAREVQDGAIAAARRRSADLRARLAAERGALASHGRALKDVQASSRGLLDPVAARALAAVRDALDGLVLRAELGLADVAWSRARAPGDAGQPQRDDRAEAIARLGELAARRPGDPRFTPGATLKLAELLRQTDPARSIALYRDVVARFPDHRLAPAARYQLAQGLDEAGRAEEARDAYQALAERHPDSAYAPEAWVRVGDWWFDAVHESALERAAAAYERMYAHPDHPLFPRALYMLAWTHHRMGDRARAADAAARLEQAGGSAELVATLREETRTPEGDAGPAEEVVARLPVAGGTRDGAPAPDPAAEAAVRAHLTAALAGRRLGDERAARAGYRAAVEEFDRRGLRPEVDAGASAAAAEARFRLAEYELARYDRMGLPATSSTAKVERALSAKLREARRVAAQYDEVMRYRRPDWILAASYRKAFVVERLARTISGAPAPPDLSSPGAKEYRSALARAAQPFEDEAVRAYVEADAAARKLRLNGEWAGRIRASLARLRPDEYPLRPARTILAGEEGPASRGAASGSPSAGGARKTPASAPRATGREVAP